MTKRTNFNEENHNFLIFFTVSTAIDFGLDVEQEVRKAFRMEGISIPNNFQELINKWL